jgi:hypothetical protein
MRRAVTLLIVVMLGGAAGGADYVARLTPIEIARLEVQAAPVDGSPLHASRRLRLVEGWSLSSRNRELGGISAMIVEEGDLLALTDRGALIRFDGARMRAPDTASILPLPEGCAHRELKTERDSESLAVNPMTGQMWIGFEWRNAICEIDDVETPGVTMRPDAMRNWPRTGGAEAMLRLGSGTLLVLAERPSDGGRTSPLLAYPQSDLSADPIAMRYRPPEGYRPTDMAELPDGSLLILNRRFRAPFAFSTILVMTTPFVAARGAVLDGRPIALFKAPGIADNFEAVAVDVQGMNTHVLIASDDNYVSTQKTYLLRFELLPASGSSSVR